jgi:hypothetical protein
VGVHVWWPLAFLALVPIIILLYFLKQNVKKKDFSAIMLWREAYRTTEASKPWEKLRNNILLILQIITILLFILALMGPWLSSLGKEQTLAVLVLDNSASMDTSYEGEQTRLDAAKDAACAYVDALAEGSTIYVISGNQQAVLELSNSQDKTEAKKRIMELQQTALPGDLSVTLGLVQSCISQSEDADVVFFTDTALDVGDLDARVESFYSDVANCSVDSVSYSQKDQTLLVLVQVTNYGAESVTKEINLYGQDTQGEESLLEIAGIEIASGDTASVYFELDADTTQEAVALRAELNEEDALSGDNEAWCVLQEEQTSRVLLLTTSNLFVEKAFSNLSGVEVYRTSDEGVFDTEEGAGYDLYIFDGMLPQTLPENGNFLFINCQAEGYFDVSGQVESTKISILDSEVTTYTADATFGVNASDVYELPGWATAFLQAGDQVAGFYGSYNGHRLATFGFDLHKTDFALQAEFPILISELSDYLLDGGLTEKVSYVTGESILLHGNSNASELTIYNPDGTTDEISAGSYVEKQQPGVYRVVQTQGETQKEQSFAVQFPSGQESSVEAVQSYTTDSDGIQQNGYAGARELRNLFLIILLILMGAEWVVYVKTS